MDATNWTKSQLGKAIGLCALAGALLLLAMFFSELKNYQFIGHDATQQATISVSGDSEVYAAPDIAELSFSIVEEAKTVSEAGKKVNTKMEAVMGYLKGKGIDAKDIKNTNYSFYPKYETSPQVQCFVYPCPPQKQVLIGYEVNQSVDVKIRKIDDAGEIVGVLGDKGVTNLSNITFKVDKEDDIKATAREAAITKAKAKAEVLAKQLGVSLVRIVSYNEGGDYAVYNYARSEMMMKADAGAPSAAVLPAGENKFVSNVSIVYEIR